MQGTMSRVTIGSLILALGFVAGCDDTSGPNLQKRQSVVSSPPPAQPLSLDDRFAAVAEREPAFAGMYFDSTGRLVVRVVDPELPIATIRSAIQSTFTGPDITAATIVRRPARYSFQQLYRWGRYLPSLALIDGVLSTDIDEVHHRLRVGIASEAIRTSVENTLLDLGIPAGVVDIHEESPAELLTTLQDPIRAIPGGFKISTDQGWCTLGFNAIYQSTHTFATNGHCSDFWGTDDDNTRYYQPVVGQSNFIGTELLEATEFSSAEDSRCPTTAYKCKYSEISLNTYADAGDAGQAFLAKTTQRARWLGSLTFSGFLTIANEGLGALVGTTVDKMGARTGWTYGPVSETPQLIVVGGFYIITPLVSQMGVNHGDSGSAVFGWDGGSNATLRTRAKITSHFRGGHTLG